MDSIATEQHPTAVIGSAENLADKNDSLDGAASSLVKVVATSQAHTETTRCLGENSSNLNEMVTNESIGKPLKEKHLELMDVNDDCLSAIFDHLAFSDLASVADVCKRFRSIAQRDFWLKKPIVNIPQDVYSGFHKETSEIPDDEKGQIIQRASRLLRNFGSFMTELEVVSVESAEFDKKLIALIIKYCGRNLTALKLYVKRTRKLPVGLKPIFNNLKKLDYFSISGIDTSVSKWLTVVEDLTMQSGTLNQYRALFKRSFPNLRRVYFKLEETDSYDLAMFWKRHKTLKDIRVECLVGNHILKLPVQIERLYLPIDRTALGCIEMSSFRTLENLESLELRIDEMDSDFLPTVAVIIREIIAGSIQLKHLTLDNIRLEMCDESRELCDVLSTLVNLETLTLKDLWYQNIDAIKQLSSKLRSVNELHLPAALRRTVLIVDEIVSIVSCFHNLQRLKVFSRGDGVGDPVIFDSKAFERFVTIVQSRNNNTRLDIELDGRYYKLELSNDLARRHRHILNVKELE